MIDAERVEPRRRAIGRAIIDEDELELFGRKRLAEQRVDACVDAGPRVVDGHDDADLDRSGHLGAPRIIHVVVPPVPLASPPTRRTDDTRTRAAGSTTNNMTSPSTVPFDHDRQARARALRVRAAGPGRSFDWLVSVDR
jgi:hypothetical protein